MAWTDPRTWTDGELVTASVMNAHVRDNLAATSHIYARKTADQSVISSTTLVNCTDLGLTVAANEVWHVRFFLVWTSSTTADMKLGFTFPAGGEVRLFGFFLVADGVTASFMDWIGTTSPTTGEAITGNSGGQKVGMPIEGVYVNGGTAGSLQLQFAQNTSEAVNSTIHANATLWATKLA